MEKPIPPSSRAIAKSAEKLLYALAVALTPNIPLYFIYGRNAAYDLKFSYFLISGAVLAAVSVAFYFPISKLYLRRRRTMLLLAAFWLLFWTFPSLRSAFNIIFRPKIGKAYFGIGLMLLVIAIAFILRRVPVTRLTANVTAAVICLMFAFNFLPAALAVGAEAMQRAENERLGELPFEARTDFNIDPSLPNPNIYWLHMDGMMGFSGVEYFFGDTQADLKQELELRGFVINEGARLDAGFTRVAIPALLSPAIFDSFLGGELAAVSHLTRSLSQDVLKASFSGKGISYDDFYSRIELLKAFSDADYLTLSTSPGLSQSESMDILVQEESFFTLTSSYREAIAAKTNEEAFVDLLCDASALSIFEDRIVNFMDAVHSERIELIQGQTSQPIPKYDEIVSKYFAGSSDRGKSTARMLRQIKYASTLPKPILCYHVNFAAHVTRVEEASIGGIDYGEIIGVTFVYDEDGNFYKERLEDPYDLSLYLPNHKYAVMTMMAQVDTILEDDPDAVIILQGDHGIHGFGPQGRGGYFSSEFLLERGYSIEEQLFMNYSVISAVRVPPELGYLTEPLDPLDISRWLVNNFVGGGNYGYLYYSKGDVSQ